MSSSLEGNLKTASPKDRRWSLFAVLGTGYLMTILDGTSLITALPSIEHDLSLTTSDAQWVLTVYALVFSSLLLLSGRGTDVFGRRRFFLGGMGLRVIASLLCGFAPSADILIGARALQGLSAAIVAPAALSMVINAFPEGPQRNKALGVWGGLGGFGATAGLLLGGVLTSTVGWQYVFWLNVPVGLAVLLIAPRLVAESRGPRKLSRYDLASSLIISGALSLLVYAIITAPNAGFASPRTLAPLLASAALFAIFIRLDHRSEHPLIPHASTGKRTQIGGNILNFIAGMAVDGMLVTLTGFVQITLRWPALHFGFLAIAMTVASVLGAIGAQVFVKRRTVRIVAIVGISTLGLACLCLASIVSGSTSAPTLILVLCLFGLAMGTVAVCGQIAGLTGVSESVSGVAAALVDTSFAVGTAVGVAITTSVIFFVSHQSQSVTLAADRAGFAVGAVFAIGGLVAASLLIGNSNPRNKTPLAS